MKHGGIEDESNSCKQRVQYIRLSECRTKHGFDCDLVGPLTSHKNPLHP